MEIEINNIAKVKKANIVIDGITVIAGYNGSGKSTVCKALYSMCSTFCKLNHSINKSREDSIINCLEEWEENIFENDKSRFYFGELSDKFFDMVYDNQIDLEMMSKDQLNKIIESCDIKTNDENLVELYEALRKVIERPIYEYVKFIVERNFLNCFSAQINTLGHNKKSKIKLKYGKSEASVEFQKNKLLQSSCNQISMGNPMYIETHSYLDMLMLQKRRRLFVGKLPVNVLEESREKLTLEQYNEINEAKSICEQIINEVTHGELISNSNREITYKEQHIKEEIFSGNIASGLKNILMIQKMLENGRLNSNTLLIIDEPEVNLHPDWQVKFAEILVLLNSRMKIKMILNTHSPYFMRAIESKMAENDIAEHGMYYYMRQDKDNEFIAENVTGKTEVVYSTMYRPLEEL